MLQPRLPSAQSLSSSFDRLSICTRVFKRNASHASQGRANGPKDSAGRRLGAKKTASQWVIPGNIIYKQRGTLWFPGENCGIGKDHTIYSLVHGYVRYYKNPALHPKRKYIGVALAKDGPESILPTPPNAPTRRRLNMHAAPLAQAPDLFEPQTVPVAEGESGHPTQPQTMSTGQILRTTKRAEKAIVAPFDPKYATRHGGVGMANFEIGRLIEAAREGVEEFDRKDRFKAWRIRARKIREKAVARAAKKTRGNKGKKSNKKVVV